MTTEFKEIYLKYSDRIFRFLFWQTKDVPTAEDLTSEVFLRAFKNWRKFKGGYLQAWLYRIAKNALIDFYRGKKTTSLDKAEEISIDPQLIEGLEKKEATEKLHLALEKLPTNLKEVVILRFFEELSSIEVGVILGLSEGNVRVLQFRALKKLREELK